MVLAAMTRFGVGLASVLVCAVLAAPVDAQAAGNGLYEPFPTVGARKRAERLHQLGTGPRRQCGLARRAGPRLVHGRRAEAGAGRRRNRPGDRPRRLGRLAGLGRPGRAARRLRGCGAAPRVSRPVRSGDRAGDRRRPGRARGRADGGDDSAPNVRRPAGAGGLRRDHAAGDRVDGPAQLGHDLDLVKTCTPACAPDVRLVGHRAQAEPLHFARYDALMTAAAQRGLRVLPVLFNPPGFHSAGPSARRARAGRSRRGTRRPRRSSPRWWCAATGRTAASGARTPSSSPDPIRAWQVWNEPSLPVYWPTGPDPRPTRRCSPRPRRRSAAPTRARRSSAPGSRSRASACRSRATSRACTAPARRVRSTRSPSTRTRVTPPA